jgi:hypothetical protein
LELPTSSPLGFSHQGCGWGRSADSINDEFNLFADGHSDLREAQVIAALQKFVRDHRDNSIDRLILPAKWAFDQLPSRGNRPEAETWMRQIANIFDPCGEIKRLMLFNADGGVFMFLFTSLEDGPCSWDEYFEDVEAAKTAAEQRYRLSPDDWIAIPDPPPGCRPDCIRPASF